MSLPTDAKARKDIPAASGFVDYFPDAIIEVAILSKIGNDQHNPGKPLHWDRSKSGDESDALFRHFLERGTIDTDGVRHSAKVAWRAMALLQKELEAANEPEASEEVPIQGRSKEIKEYHYTQYRSNGQSLYDDGEQPLGIGAADVFSRP